jgi:uncharacterized membrane protein YcaP (DUF421 family)
MVKVLYIQGMQPLIDNLTQMNLPAANLIIRAVVVYISILILLRISGKRQLGQMGATEFVSILLISNAVQNSMNGGDNSLTGGLLLAVVLIGLTTIISFLTYRSRFFSRVFEGTPSLLIHKGKLVKKNLNLERLSTSELKVLLRKQGINDFDAVESAVLEADGTLSVTKKNEYNFAE